MQAERHIPGEAGFWILILGDLAVFTAFFLIFAWYRGDNLALFAEGQATLIRPLGLLNTVLLLSGSLAVAIGVRRARRGDPAGARYLAAGIATGIGFVAIKAIEYGHEIAAGVDIAGNPFFMLYFAFTGAHLMHVILATGALFYARALAAGPEPAQRMMPIECVATFWHLVDLLWIVLFSLFYLVH